jgi:hypothetical protein
LVYDKHREAGDQGHLASSAVDLAEVLVEQGHDEEAQRLAEISEAAAAPDDVDAQLGWRGVKARVLAQRGSKQKAEQAERLAREAVGIAEETDWLKGHGDALMALAEVRRLASRTQDAAVAQHEALRLYHRKGNLVLAAKARNALRGRFAPLG